MNRSSTRKGGLRGQSPRKRVDGYFSRGSETRPNGALRALSINGKQGESQVHSNSADPVKIENRKREDVKGKVRNVQTEFRMQVTVRRSIANVKTLKP